MPRPAGRNPRPPQPLHVGLCSWSHVGRAAPQGPIRESPSDRLRLGLKGHVGFWPILAGIPRLKARITNYLTSRGHGGAGGLTTARTLGCMVASGLGGPGFKEGGGRRVAASQVPSTGGRDCSLNQGFGSGYPGGPRDVTVGNLATLPPVTHWLVHSHMQTSDVPPHFIPAESWTPGSAARGARPGDTGGGPRREQAFRGPWAPGSRADATSP